LLLYPFAREYINFAIVVATSLSIFVGFSFTAYLCLLFKLVKVGNTKYGVPGEPCPSTVLSNT
jgi:hypothetical protein